MAGVVKGLDRAVQSMELQKVQKYLYCTGNVTGWCGL